MAFGLLLLLFIRCYHSPPPPPPPPWLHYSYCNLNIAPSRSPGNVIVTVQDSSTLRVLWQEIPSQYRHGVVRYYSVRVTEIATGMTILLQDSSSPLLVSSLHPYSNYSVEVAAFTVGLSPYSTATVVRTEEASKKAMLI